MNYKFYDGDGGVMELRPDYETNELFIWVENDLVEKKIVLKYTDVEDLIEVLGKFKKNATTRNKIKNLLEIKKQKEWNNSLNN